MSSLPLELKLSPRRFYIVNAALSAGALALLGYILVWRDHQGAPAFDLSFMPAVNASLNALCSVFLVCGFVAIRRGNKPAHKKFMLLAVFASALFLVGYLAYHSVHGDTRFLGTGAIKTVYLGILASHVLLSALVVPALLTVLYRALTGAFAQHRKLARWLLPVWLYVSVTGVLIFVLLRTFGGATAS